MPHSNFTENTISIIQNIPEGRVISYGLIAKLVGDARAARQVSWILHSSTRKYDLPWHRVINSKGRIAIKFIDGKEYQKYLLEQEGIEVSENYEIDLDKYLWKVNQNNLNLPK